VLPKTTKCRIEITFHNVTFPIQSVAQYYKLQSTEHLLAYTLHNALQNMPVMHCIDVKKTFQKKFFLKCYKSLKTG